MSEPRPLVIVGVGGGLVQWVITKPGTGEPDVHTLDYDREGQMGEQLRDFADEIRAASDALEAFDGPDDPQVREFTRQIGEYMTLAASGEGAPRSKW